MDRMDRMDPVAVTMTMMSFIKHIQSLSDVGHPFEDLCPPVVEDENTHRHKWQFFSAPRLEEMASQGACAQMK